MNIIKLLQLLFIITFLSLLFSCNQEPKWQTHDSGLEYRFINKCEDGTKTQIGDILMLKMRYTTDNDSLLFDTREIKGAYRMQYLKPSHKGGSVEDAFGLLNIGDSIEFKIKAKSFYEKTRKINIPSNIDPESYLIFYLKLMGIQSVNDIKAERQALYHANQEEEDNLLEHYIKIANITVEPTLSGLYYIEKKAGTGKKAQAGKKVTVHYTGKFIDGMVFDSSVERNEPFIFTLGIGQVIQGWEEGIAKMSEGGKAQLIIPSALAYGGKKNSRIPPFSTLIFEIELLKVE